MAKSKIQFQKGFSLAKFSSLYGTANWSPVVFSNEKNVKPGTLQSLWDMLSTSGT